MDAIHGFHILEEQKFKMAHAKAHIDFISGSSDEIKAELFLRSRLYDAKIKWISSVPDITELSALFILSEISADMSVFESDSLPLLIMRTPAKGNLPGVPNPDST